MSEPLFVQPIRFMVPPGFREAVHDAARQKGQSVSEFIRSAVRDKLRTAPVEQEPAA